MIAEKGPPTGCSDIWRKKLWVKLPRLVVHLWGREFVKGARDINGGFIVVNKEIEIIGLFW